VSTPSGVLYASHNGLIMIGSGGIQNVTAQIITKDEWTRDFSPNLIRAVRYQNGYLAMEEGTSAHDGFFLDPTELRVALTDLSDFDDILNLNVDFWSGEVFLIKESMVQRWDPPTTNFMPTRWKSKEFQFQYPENFGCYAIHWDDRRYTNPNYGIDVCPMGEKVRLKIYVNGESVPVYNQVVPRNGRPVRLPSGFKSDIWQFEIQARAPIYSLHVASTVKELRNV
jgi:hypothetical protein